VDANKHPSASTINGPCWSFHFNCFLFFYFCLRPTGSTIVDANKHPSASIYEVDANKHTSASTIVDPVGRSILIVFYSFIFA
jgi:hypothetical protein